MLTKPLQHGLTKPLQFGLNSLGVGVVLEALTAPVITAATEAVVGLGASVTVAGTYNLTGTPTYQWYRDGELIPGADESTYTFVEADAATDVTVVETFTSDDGQVLTQTSNVLAVTRLLSTIAVLGDSITNQGWSLVDAWQRRHTPHGYIRHAIELLGQKPSLAYNATDNSYEFATGSMTAVDVLTTHVPQAITAAPSAAVVHVGINDIALGADAATTATRVAAVWDALIAAGISVVGTEIGLQTVAAGQPRRDAILATNVLLKAAAAARALPFCEWAVAFADVDGYADQKWLSDTVHPNNAGAAIYGQYLAATLADPKFTLPSDPLPAAIVGAINANPTLAGGATLATGYTMATSGAAGSSATASKVSGDVQQIATVHPALYSAVTDIYQGSATGWEVGDTLEGFAEIETDAAGYNGAIYVLKLRAVNISYLNDSVGAITNQTEASARKASFVMRTPPGVVPSGATEIRVYLQIYGSQTIRIKKLFFRKIA